MNKIRHGRLVAGELELAPDGVTDGYKPVIGDPQQPPASSIPNTVVEFVCWVDGPKCIHCRWRTRRVRPTTNQGENK